MPTEFADFVATQDARNTIELNVRKYCLMLCDCLLEDFKRANNRKTTITNSTLNLVVSITN